MVARSEALNPENPADLQKHRRAVLMAGVSILSVAAASFIYISSAQAASAPPSIVEDSFDREIAAGWGTAPLGGRYAIDDSANADVRVTGGSAKIMNLKPGGSISAVLLNVSAVDVDVTGSFALPSGVPTHVGLYHAWEIRRQKDGTSYRGRLEIGSGGKTTLAVSKVLKSGETNLARVILPMALTPDISMTAEYQVTGTSPVTIRGRAWLTGTATPEWQSVIVDSSTTRIRSSGTLGIWEYNSQSTSDPVTTAMDDLNATDLGALETVSPTSSPTLTPTPTGVPGPTPPLTEPPAPTTGSPAAAPARGSAPVGTATYPVPSGATFVDGTRGSDSAAGTEASPYRTISAAVAKARAGGTVVVRGGTYHESVSIPKALILQSYPGEAVWLDGSSAVSEWTKSGSTWIAPWNVRFDYTMDGVADNPRFVSSSNPMASRPDQLFYDGEQLRQVPSAAQVVPGTFAVDYASGRLLVGNEPAGHSIRASDLQQAISATGPNVTLLGFGVRGYASSYEIRSAVRLGNVNGTARDLVLIDNAMIGLTIENNSGRADHLSVERNGLLGIGVNQSYGLKISNSLVTNNDSQLFKEQPVSGGIKVTRSRGITIANNDTSDNQTKGIWLDESCSDFSIVNNVSNDNGDASILAELSDTGVVANNRSVGNQIGVQLYDTGNVKVFNNSLGGNSLFDLKLAQDERRQAVNGYAGRDPRQPVPDPTMTWITRNIEISNNVFGDGGLYQFYALDGVTGIPVDNMNVTITGNLFNLKTAESGPILVGWGTADKVTLEKYNTPAALASAKNLTWKNAMTATPLPLDRMALEIAAAAPIAVPQPPDVARATGEPAGTRRLGAPQ